MLTKDEIDNGTGRYMDLALFWDCIDTAQQLATWLAELNEAIPKKYRREDVTAWLEGFESVNAEGG